MDNETDDEADWVKGFVFGGENEVQISAASQTDDDFFFANEELCLVTVLLWLSKASVIGILQAMTMV